MDIANGHGVGSRRTHAARPRQRLPLLGASAVVNAGMRAVAIGHPTVLLVDTARVLADKFSNPRLNLLSADGWPPNTNGYRLLAATILEALVESRMFRSFSRSTGQ